MSKFSAPSRFCLISLLCSKYSIPDFSLVNQTGIQWWDLSMWLFIAFLSKVFFTTMRDSGWMTWLKNYSYWVFKYGNILWFIDDLNGLNDKMNFDNVTE